MASQEAFGVLWHGKVYHRLGIDLPQCGEYVGVGLQQRLQGDGAREWLEANGYDGLFSAEYECGCVIGDIASCGDIGGSCEAGYKAFCDDACTHERSYPPKASDWHVQREKPGPGGPTS